MGLAGLGTMSIVSGNAGFPFIMYFALLSFDCFLSCITFFNENQNAIVRDAGRRANLIETELKDGDGYRQL